MNTKETAKIVGHINDGVHTILGRIRINTWIFGASMVVTTSLMVMMIFVLIWLNQANATAISGKQVALAANAMAADAKTAADANQTKYDEMFKQYSDYIQQNIEVWNKLQRDNFSPKDVQRRGIIVPVAPKLRPPGLPSPTDKELERITRPVPALAPESISKTRERSKPPRKARPSPTPTKPWWKYFEQTR